MAFIPGTTDFFIALADHTEWGTSHIVFAEVEDFVSTDLIAIQRYHEVTHEKYGEQGTNACLLVDGRPWL